MNPATRQDFFWLVSPEATPLLKYCQEAIANKTNAVRIIKTLRKKTTPTRSAILLELAQLRVRARKKFPFADEMYLTRKGYEQATGALLADYKAQRFTRFERVADVCCGIGGDLMFLAKREIDCETIGVDQDPLACLYAKQNLGVAGVAGHAEVIESAFESYDLSSFDAIHIDPDRRIHGRTVQSNFFVPSIPEILPRISDGNLAIKVAPATPEPEQLPLGVEREWIGDRRECKQQVLWFGEMAVHPGALTATCVNQDGSLEQISVAGDEIDSTIFVAHEIGPYIFEPHASVLAAKLTDTIANRHNLARLAAGIAYLTGDQPLSTSLMTRYKVLKTTALNVRSVAEELARLEVGQIEVKNRGAEKLLTEQFSRLKLDGPRRVSLLLTRHKRRGIAIIAKRELV